MKQLTRGYWPILVLVALMLLACAPAPVSRPPASEGPLRQAPGQAKSITIAVGTPIQGLSAMGMTGAGSTVGQYVEMQGPFYLADSLGVRTSGQAGLAATG